VNLLLDTNIVLWVMSGSAKLPKAARREIERADTVYVSAASVWEISIKAALGKLTVDLPRFVDALGEAGFLALPISWQHAQRASGLPHRHRNPFDRMLIAQALSEPLRLLTHDEQFAGYSELVTCV